MQRQFKQLPYFKVESEGRVRKGICAVFGNVDSWGDRIQNGAFAKTISEGRSRVKHLWNHDFSTPPIASITELKEVSREELPTEVLAFAPEATGGLYVAREYYDTELSNWILKAIDAGDITEMSFGYDVIRSEDVKEDERNVRELKELKLFDTSDVLWGMNAATVASGAKTAMPLGVLVSQIDSYAQEIKAGRRNAESDMKLIRQLHDISVGLGCDNCKAIEEDTPKSDEPKPSDIDTSLSANRLNLLKLRNLTLERV